MEEAIVYPAWYYDITWYMVTFVLPLFIVIVKTFILWEFWKLLMMINFYIRSVLWPSAKQPARVDMITVRSRIVGWLRRKLHLS